MNVIKKRYWFLGFSGLAVAVAVAALVVFGLKAGIDLMGGTQWDIAFRAAPHATEADVRAALAGAGQTETSVKKTSDGTFIVRFPNVTEETHHALAQALEQKFGALDEKSFSSIGPAIGSELRKKSIWAIVLVLFGISLYIAYVFRKVSRPIQSWKYGVVTLLTLFHDVVIPAGMLAILGRFMGIEIDTNFIVALLVVMGFSVHDTIVVFDRIRENILLARGKTFDLGDLIDRSVHETFQRSLNTSFTLFLVLLAMLVFGPASLFFFVLTMMVGTIFGTYSSIFVASPLLYVWEKLGERRVR